MTPTFTASTAGRNCTLAIQPRYACSVPVKSSNSRVIPIQNTHASTTLIFFNIGPIIVICANIRIFFLYLQTTKSE